MAWEGEGMLQSSVEASQIGTIPCRMHGSTSMKEENRILLHHLGLTAFKWLKP